MVGKAPRRVRIRNPLSGKHRAPHYAALGLVLARNWRDRFLLVLLWFTGLRIGQALGLCRALRATILGAGENPLLFVNVTKNPGSGMTPGYADALFQRLSVRDRDPANSSAHVPARVRLQ